MPYEADLFDYFNVVDKVMRLYRTQSLLLGGITSSGGGTGGPAGGFIGRLPQTRVTYDLSELADNSTPASGESLLDNLNHIRYDIEQIDASIEVLEDTISGISVSGVEEAPIDGSQYAREDGAWTVVSISGGVTNHSDLDELDYASAGHTGFLEDTTDIIKDTHVDWGTGAGQISTADIPEQTNLYYTDERVDDRVADLIQDGTGITWEYDDVNGTLTPTVTISGGTGDVEEAPIDGATYGRKDADWIEITTSGSGSSDASTLTYTPSVVTDWDGDADPGNADDAFDQLAERVDDLETTPPAHNQNHDTIILPNGEGTPSYDDLRDWFVQTRSSGRITGGVVTAHTDGGANGKIDVSELQGMIFTTNDPATAELVYFKKDTVTDITVTDDNAVSWVYYDYTTDTYATTITRADIHEYDQFTLARVWRSGNSIEVQSTGHNLYDKDRRSHNRLILKYGNMDHVSGAIISAHATPLQLTCSVGNWYVANKAFTAPTTNPATTFEVWYKASGSATWLESSEMTLFSDVFDGGTSKTYEVYQNGNSLAALGANQYGVCWIFLCPEGGLYVLLGTSSYTNIGNAQASSVPSVLPPYLVDWGKLIGRVIVKKSASAFYSVETVFANTFTQSAATDHESLSNLNTATYTHLSAANALDLTDGGETTLHTHLISGYVEEALIDGKQYGREDGGWTEIVASSGVSGNFIDLGDVPSSYDEEADKIPVVNSTEDGLEFCEIVNIVTEEPSGESGSTDLTTGLGASMSASSEFNGYPASKLVDDNNSSEWASSTNSEPQWVKIDLGSAYKTGKFAIRASTSGDDYELQKFQFQGSNDDSNWTDLYTQSETLYWIPGERKEFTITFEGPNPVAYRLYRLYITQTKDWSQFAEWEIFNWIDGASATTTVGIFDEIADGQIKFKGLATDGIIAIEDNEMDNAIHLSVVSSGATDGQVLTSDGSDGVAWESISTTNVSEGTNLFYTDERVDDRIAALIQDGTGITWDYDDGAGTLTPTITVSGGGVEEAPIDGLYYARKDGDWEEVTVSGISDASDIAYTPTISGDWNSSMDPGNVDNALDQLAERITDVEGAGGSPHAILSATHTDTSVTVPNAGDVLTWDGVNSWWEATAPAGGAVDASVVTYTPTTAADWDSSMDPGDADNAFDQLAERVTDLEGATATISMIEVQVFL